MQSCIESYQPHPEIVAYLAETLRSLNARVGCLLPPTFPDPGADLPPLGTAWINDIRRIDAVRTMIADLKEQKGEE